MWIWLPGQLLASKWIRLVDPLLALPHNFLGTIFSKNGSNPRSEAKNVNSLSSADPTELPQR